MGSRIFDIPIPMVYKTLAVRYRQPFDRAADLVVPPATSGVTFADGSFYNALDMPWEVTALIPNVTVLDSSGNPIESPADIADLFSYIRLKITLVTSNTPVTFQSTRLSVLVDKETLAWQFDAPIVLETRNGFVVTVDNQLPATIGESTNGGIRMELGFVGSLLALNGTLPSS